MLHQAAIRPSHRTIATVLVTGSCGTVGRTILAGLQQEGTSGRPSIGVTARRYLRAGGDVAEQLRLDPARSEHDSPARKVDAVVHISTTSPLRPLADSSVRRMREVLEFVERAEVPLYYIGSAYTDHVGDELNPREAADPEMASEAAIRRSGVPHVIIRPSLIIGDSASGAISASPGVDQFIRLMLQTDLGRLPVDPDGLTDLIPVDVVVDVVDKLIGAKVTTGEFWLTNGEQALTAGQCWHALLNCAAEMGFDAGEVGREPGSDAGVDRDQLTRPGLGRADLRRLGMLFHISDRRIVRDRPLESSLGDRFQTSISELGGLGVAALPDQRSALLASLRYWVKSTDPFRRRRLVA